MSNNISNNASKPIMLVTGGSRGIGAATAIGAAARGYQVAFSYLNNKTAADDVVKQIQNAGGHALAIQADVGIEDHVLRLFKTVDETMGTLSVLVNNAGMLEQKMRLDQMDLGRW